MAKKTTTTATLQTCPVFACTTDLCVEHWSILILVARGQVAMFKAGSKYSMISINFEFMRISVHFIYFFCTFNLIFESQINASQFGLQTTRLRGINIQSLALQRDNWKCFLSYPSDFLIELHFSFAVIELYATKLKNWCHRTTSADSCDNETGNYRMLEITETCFMRVEQHTHKMGPEGGREGEGAEKTLGPINPDPV